METLLVPRISVAARLDRLPITSFHRQIMWLLGFVFFFELADLSTFSFAAPAIRVEWYLSISTIGFITSATFVGMFIGATTGGLSDHVGQKSADFHNGWYAGFSLFNAFVWGSTALFLARLLTGLGLSAMTVVGITYISEMFPAKLRGAHQGWTLMVALAKASFTRRFAPGLR